MTVKLVNAVPQRWSSMVNVLERVLLKWDILQNMWDPDRREDDGTPPRFPLHGMKIQIRELYSVLRLVSNIIKMVQGKGYCTAAEGWLNLVSMRVRELSFGEHVTLTIWSPEL